MTGRGECVPYPALRRDARKRRWRAIEAMRIRLRAGSTASLQAAMPPGAARNALDCALWDLEAKRAGQRVWSLLGRPAPQPLHHRLHDLARHAGGDGGSAAKAAHRPLLKMKLGGDGDAERVAAVREAAPRIRLIVDANEAWTPDNLDAIWPPAPTPASSWSSSRCRPARTRRWPAHAAACRLRRRKRA